MLFGILCMLFFMPFLWGNSVTLRTLSNGTIIYQQRFPPYIITAMQKPSGIIEACYCEKISSKEVFIKNYTDPKAIFDALKSLYEK